jgi:hypothetical protein
MLVVVPVVLTVARESSFESSLDVTTADAETTETETAAWVRTLFEPRTESNETRQAAPPLRQDPRIVADDLALADRVTATPTGRGVLVRVWGRTPAEANRLGDALARKLHEAAGAGGTLIVRDRRISGPTGTVDRTIDALPGPYPGRPNPVWAGVAGLLVAVSIMGALLLSGRGLSARSRERKAVTRPRGAIVRQSS